METPQRYSTTAIVLHWAMALLLVAQFAIGWTMIDLPKRTPAVAWWYGLHKSIGIGAFLLAALRLAWRLHAPRPAAWSGAASQQRAAQAVHRLLYGCMLALPLAGWLGSSFGKHPVKFFGIPLPQPFAPDPWWQDLFRGLHAGLAWLLCVLVAAHVAAVAFHAWKGERGLLARMLPGRPGGANGTGGTDGAGTRRPLPS